MTKRYKLPEALGGIEVEILTDVFTVHDTVDVRVLAGAAKGLTLEIERQWLTEVAPPIPEEPGPGAYKIGEYMVVRFPGRENEANWCYPELGHRAPDWSYGHWDDVWREIGGPDVTIRRAVFLEPVELPWQSKLAPSLGVSTAIGCGCFGEDDGARLVDVRVGTTTQRVSTEEAHEMAVALLTATGDLA